MPSAARYIASIVYVNWEINEKLHICVYRIVIGFGCTGCVALLNKPHRHKRRHILAQSLHYTQVLVGGNDSLKYGVCMQYIRKALTTHTHTTLQCIDLWINIFA